MGLTANITPAHCFAKCAEAIEAGSLELAQQWRLLGETIALTNLPVESPSQ